MRTEHKNILRLCDMHGDLILPSAIANKKNNVAGVGYSFFWPGI